ncbi:gamma-glutamylcyclotransferase [Vibrio sp. JPW-9-11-11]|uniref:gamma-glutamylcyclotransferase family protein n=1 Tax=Vibrio sp. JPW-9-11-11 TaxID=1416532 RepID=UPI001592BFB7|nr:gamma-glutamylcyclotransferase family protein [Vibrio sp. JPW-9-11-11]NVD05935.1 gamma-glutamylcyclotransferase [Vibrio sp. JPW-9-11-11]
MAQYIFGYGSLMNSASRQLTGQTSTAVPSTAHGFTRYWGKVDDSYILSPLVVDKGQGQVNGVVLEVDEQGLAEFDRRERGYHRVVINAQQLDTPLALTRQDTVWVYIKDNPEPPCSLSPIMQTYVDTVLAGCLEISEQFAKQFVEHTVGWHFPLENDRHQPKYGNLAGVSPQHHAAIDALVSVARS